MAWDLKVFLLLVFMILYECSVSQQEYNKKRLQILLNKCKYILCLLRFLSDSSRVYAACLLI